MPLTSIAAHAADYELLLPALVALTAEVEEKRSHGCKLLDIIAAHANCGIPLVLVPGKRSRNRAKSHES